MFEHNTAINGGGLFIEKECTVSINESEIGNNAATLRGGAIAIRGSVLILTETVTDNNRAQGGASVSACRSTVYTNEKELQAIRDPVPVYAHCVVNDGDPEITESTLTSATNSTLHYEMGIDISVTNFNNGINSCNLHPKIGFIVALVTLVSTSLVLIGFILTDKVYYYLKRNTSSSALRILTSDKKSAMGEQPQGVEMQPFEKKMDLGSS